jgi:AcrR family transcriptional regulator
MAKTRDPAATREALLEAAERAFEVDGYFGTDSNKIARAAGYAPATFYRHFIDKNAIFLAVYDRVVARTWDAIDARCARTRSPAARVRVGLDLMLAQHKTHRALRAALRTLMLEDARLAAARRALQATHLDRLARTLALKPNRNAGALLSAVLLFERYADAVADGELDATSPPSRAVRADIEARLTALAKRDL